MIRLENADSMNEKEQLTQQRLGKQRHEDFFGPHIQHDVYPMVTFATNDNIQTPSVRSRTGISPLQVKSPSISLKLQRSSRSVGSETILIRQKQKIGQSYEKLKQILRSQKVQVIVQNFAKKLSRNNTYSTPVDYTPFLDEKQLSFLDTQGIQLSDKLQIGAFFCSTVLIVLLSIIFTLNLVFDQVKKTTFYRAVSSISFIYFLFELGLNFVTVKCEEGKRLVSLRQIWSFYARNTLITDLLTLVVLLIDQFTDETIANYMQLFVILKLGQAFEKLQKLQVFFIHNFYYEQYWSLIKVFLFNFSLAHILAIALVAMAGFNDENSWMGYKDIYLAPWYEKYAWAYYWATTIMLTVGFGDLTATNYQEAVILTLVEMISCIALAYNINCVGMLISNIRSQDLEKGKNFKVFYKLSRKNNLSQDLEWRINNYIEESSNIKKKFNYEEENYFVEKLPNGLKTEFLKESHKKIFQNLPFFKHLMQKTLFNFAQKIEMHICHPEEVIQHIDDPHNLLILKGGEIGFTCKKSGCNFNSTVIDQLKTLDNNDPILISLGFIRTPRLIYEIKSLAYSVLYFLDFENILNILRGSQMDYELYCLLRDKSLVMPDEYELFHCEICDGKHTKFACPKLHFIPITQHVVNKHLFSVKFGRTQRYRSFNRNQGSAYKALNIYKCYNQLKHNSSEKIITKKSLLITRRVGFAKRNNYENIIHTSTPTNMIKEMNQIKDFLSKNAAEFFKSEMAKAMHNEGGDDIWIVETDKMKNFKSYFEADNSCNLTEKFSVSKRSTVLFHGCSIDNATEEVKSKRAFQSWKKFYTSQLKESKPQLHSDKSNAAYI